MYTLNHPVAHPIAHPRLPTQMPTIANRRLPNWLPFQMHAHLVARQWLFNGLPTQTPIHGIAPSECPPIWPIGGYPTACLNQTPTPPPQLPIKGCQRLPIKTPLLHNSFFKSCNLLWPTVHNRLDHALGPAANYKVEVWWVFDSFFIRVLTCQSRIGIITGITDQECLGLNRDPSRATG